MLKLPPYGKYLDDLQSKDLAPSNSVYLFIGHKAFDKAKGFNKIRAGTICLPPYNDPGMYRWPVKGCDILIFDTGWCEPDYINDLVYYLYQAEAMVVRSISPEFKMSVYDK